MNLNLIIMKKLAKKRLAFSFNLIIASKDLIMLLVFAINM